MKLTRFSSDPVLAPNCGNAWESLITTNPAAWREPATGKVSLLYRAAGGDPEHIVRLGLAESTDGFHFKRVSPEPVFAPLPGNYDGGCIEDPRLVKFGDWFFLTYACRPAPNGQYWMGARRAFRFALEPELPAPFGNNGMMTAIAFSRDLRQWRRGGFITHPEQEDHDVILFPEKINGRYWYLHRPLFDGQIPGIWLADADNPLRLNHSRVLAMPREDWEAQKIGGNAPPLRTDRGWLVIYHGVGRDGYYRLGALLLDSNDPDRVIGRTPEPIFEPEAWYELEGCHNFKGVVFPCGNAIIGDRLVVYYGAADRYIGIAYCPLAGLLDELARSCAK